MNLGEKMFVSGFCVEGYRGPTEMLELQRKLTEVIEMMVAGGHAEWSYPLPDGKGGSGSTVVVPFTESFCSCFSPGAVFGDSYQIEPDGHFFILLASCKQYDISLVKEFLSGYGKVLDYDIFNLYSRPGEHV